VHMGKKGSPLACLAHSLLAIRSLFVGDVLRAEGMSSVDKPWLDKMNKKVLFASQNICHV
jgi:hypothetical protein